MRAQSELGGVTLSVAEAFRPPGQARRTAHAPPGFFLHRPAFPGLLIPLDSPARHDIPAGGLPAGVLDVTGMEDASELEALPEVRIRPAGIDDLPGIFHLGERLFTSHEVSNLYRTWDEYEVTHLFNTEPEYMLTARADGVLVGFLLGSVIEKRFTAWNYGHLLWLGVDPAWVGRGIASRLFEQFRDLVREAGVRMLMVDTQADNVRAIRFFNAKGFTNPIDHVYMTLNLDSDEA